MTAATSTITSAPISSRRPSRRRAGPTPAAGANAASAATAASAIRIRSLFCVPIHPTNTRLTATAPMIAPTVLAA